MSSTSRRLPLRSPLAQHAASRPRRTWRPAVLAHAVALACCGLAGEVAAPAWAQSAPAAAPVARQNYDIGAGPLAPALRRLASTAGVMLSFTNDQTEGKSTAGLHGQYTAPEAFAALLAGSGLQAVQTTNGSYLLRALSSPPSSSSLPTVSVSASSQEEPPSEKTGSYNVRNSRGATGLNLSLRETPQSVSIISRQQMDDFHLSSVNSVLDATPGVVVEKVETERTYYTARGFNITTFQDDGVGIPFTHGLVGNDLDTAIYDRVEVVRGANGLLSNTGNPSATVNFIRKRPTAEFQASASASYGSWDTKRIEGDISSPLNEAKTLRGRVVVAGEDGNSYLDRYSRSKSVFHGVLEADIGERTTLTFGHTYQKNKARHQLWGGLPLYYSNGTPTDFARSTNTAADYSYWDTLNTITFLEAVHRFDNEWEAKAVYTHKEIDWDGKLFYVYGQPNATTGLGLMGQPGDYHTKNKQDLFDVRASGPFTLGGRKHELTFGANASSSSVSGLSLNSVDVALPALQTWTGSAPAPVFNIFGGAQNFRDRQESGFVASRFNLADDFKLIVGANYTRAHSSGLNYGTPRDKSNSEVTPYAGAVYDINRTVSAYASYTEIFNPQSEINASFQKLDPVRGKTYEAGLKAEFLDKRLLGTASVFKTEQSNLATYVTNVGAPAIYQGTDVKSDGVEFELAGQVNRDLQISGGFTAITLKDKDGRDTRLYTPRRIFRLATTYRVPGIENLKVGATLNWRSETSAAGSAISTVTIRQPAYTLINLMARYDINRSTFVTFNVNNVTDKKYLTSLYWADTGYYGAPRNFTVALNWKY